ncbi:hypothetical protein BDR22DRAFT_819481 [Usnea florida]
MENGSGNPKPSWQQSACTRASAAAEPGSRSTRAPSAVWHPISDPSHAGRDLYNAYGALVTPGNLIPADLSATTFVNNDVFSFVHPNSLLAYENTSTADAIHVDGIKYPTTPSLTNWGGAAATVHQINSAYAPLTNSNTVSFDGRTFATGKGYKDDDALLTAPFCHNWGTTGAAAHLDNHAYAPLIGSSSSRLTASTFAAGPTYSDVAASPQPPIPYTWEPAATTGHSSNHALAPFIASNPLHLTENTFATGAAYSRGNDNTGAPWGPAAPKDFTDPFSDSGLQDADPTFHMMNPFAADASGTGNDYQGRITAPSSNTPLEAAVYLPKTPHATHDNDLDLAPQRPTCTKCNQAFTRKADLDRHAKKHQADAKVFRCGVVGCTFDNYRKDKVLVHIRRRHGGVGAVLTLA